MGVLSKDAGVLYKQSVEIITVLFQYFNPQIRRFFALIKSHMIVKKLVYDFVS